MTLDEALSKVVLGYYARHDGMAPNAYIKYEFNGWRIEFNHDGRVGSSSAWLPSNADKEADWYLTNTIVPKAWGKFQTVCWDVEAAVDVVDPEEPLEMLPPSGFIDPYAPEADKQLEKAMNKPVKSGWANYGN